MAVQVTSAGDSGGAGRKPRDAVRNDPAPGWPNHWFRPPLGRALARYMLAVASVAAATFETFHIQSLAEKPLAFPFYASVVISAWLGTGPGFVAVVLSVLAVELLWASPYYTLEVGAGDLPWFLFFVTCMVLSFAWSWQRRRTESGLAVAVEQRNAELERANTALQAEMAERGAAQQERDRSERALRAAEAELTRTLRLATVAELAAAIAHEINQPLAAITANGSACVRSLTRDPPLLDNAREAAGCIVADGHRAADVIGRVRALFNKEQPNKHPVAINALIQHVLDLSRAAIERQRVSVRTELAAGEPVVLADAVQLQQVLLNLVTNALDAMTGNTTRARLLAVRSSVESGGAVLVTVADTGSGLDPEQRDRIFESFYTTKPGGIGLGLSISRSIVEAHGGTIWAEAAAPCGARFGFRLPLDGSEYPSPNRA